VFEKVVTKPITKFQEGLKRLRRGLRKTDRGVNMTKVYYMHYGNVTMKSQILLISLIKMWKNAMEFPLKYV
jgi:hypothetical protein